MLQTLLYMELLIKLLLLLTLILMHDVPESKRIQPFHELFLLYFVLPNENGTYLYLIIC